MMSVAVAVPASLSHSATSWVPPGRKAGSIWCRFLLRRSNSGAAGGRVGGGAARMLPSPPSGAADCMQCLGFPAGRLRVKPLVRICTSFSRAVGGWDTQKLAPHPSCSSYPALRLTLKGILSDFIEFNISLSAFSPNPAQNHTLRFFFHAPVLDRAPTAGGEGG